MDHALFTVSSPPSLHNGRTYTGLMWETLLALTPAAVMAVYFYGMDAARVIGLSCSAAVAVEHLGLRLSKLPGTIHDANSLLIGLIFSFLLPASAPWWLVLIGAALCIVMGKLIFGGVGGNPLHPALVGWAACTISWPARMNPDIAVLNTPLVSPLFELKYYGAASVANMGWHSLLFEGQLGGLGATQPLALLLGGLYLILRGRLRLPIPLGVLTGVLLASSLFWLADPDAFAPPHFHLLAGATIFAAFFLAPEQASSPSGPWAMPLWSVFAGMLIVIIRTCGVYTDGTAFAILLAELTTPLFDRIRPKAFGKSCGKDLFRGGGHA
jgi:electron transport complex protein RnfD